VAKRTKKIKGKTLELLSAHYTTRTQAERVAKVRRHRGFHNVSVSKEPDGWAVYGL